jgi:uncharacterized protein (DUF983 family)
MLWRGVRRKCPRCGSGRVFRSWFEMVDRCPRCGLRFERESDFWLGAYVVNLAVTEGLLVVALLAYVFRAVSDPTTPSAPVVLAALVFAIGAPLAFFPFSRTIWAAIDLAMRPVPPEPPEGP